jgi:hypothetical protein
MSGCRKAAPKLPNHHSIAPLLPPATLRVALRAGHHSGFEHSRKVASTKEPPAQPLSGKQTVNQLHPYS